MPQIHRAMTREGNKPKLGSTARTLGVRVPPACFHDIPVDPDGTVAPRTSGMSVAPAWRALPLHRIPRRLRHLVPWAAGNDNDACWRMGDGPFEDSPVTAGLLLRVEPSTHGLVEPVQRVSLSQYQAALADTRDHWVVDEA